MLLPLVSSKHWLARRSGVDAGAAVRHACSIDRRQRVRQPDSAVVHRVVVAQGDDVDAGLPARWRAAAACGRCRASFACVPRSVKVPSMLPMVISASARIERTAANGYTEPFWSISVMMSRSSIRSPTALSVIVPVVGVAVWARAGWTAGLRRCELRIQESEWWRRDGTSQARERARRNGRRQAMTKQMQSGRIRDRAIAHRVAQDVDAVSSQRR